MHQFGEASPDKVFHALLHPDWSKVNLALPLRIGEVAARDMSGLRLKADIATGRHGTWAGAPLPIVSIESGKKSTGLG